MMPVSAERRAEIAEMSDATQTEYVKKRTEKLLAARERSSRELEDRLRRLGFSEAVVAQEIERLERVGLVDNERFARLFISSKKRALWGKRRIESELGRFGISPKELAGYPEEYFEETDETERALICLSKFTPKAKNHYQARYARLASKGFTPDIIRQALQIYERDVLSVDLLTP